MFRLGDRVRYVWDSGFEMRSVEGHVCHVDREWVGMQIDHTAERCPGDLVAFSSAGNFTTSRGGYRSPNPSGRLELIQPEQTMPREYPPEPYIGYGSFDSNHRPLEPYHAGTVFIGHGILNLPRCAPGIVYQELDDEWKRNDLNDYLGTAKVMWESEKLEVDFDNLPNKWHALVGCRITGFAFYADYLSMMIKVPERNDFSSWFDLRVRYNHTCVVPGISSVYAICSSFNDTDGRVGIASVDGEVITNTDGLQWAAVPRYLERTGVEPTWELTPILRQKLMRNLVMQRELRDSEPIAA